MYRDSRHRLRTAAFAGAAAFLFPGLVPAANADGGFFAEHNIAKINLATPISRLDQDREVTHRGLMSDGAVVLPVKLRARGRLSLEACRFPKLRLDFKDKDAEGTSFEGLDPLRVNTHCDRLEQGTGDYGTELIPFREAVAYRLLDYLVELSLRSRQATVTYYDVVTGASDTKPALFIEHRKVAGKRFGLKPTSREKAKIQSLEDEVKWIEQFHAEDLARASLFNAMVLNSDWVLRYLHNLEGFEQGEWIRLVPYDFDFSDVVNGAIGGISDEEVIARIGGYLEAATYELSIHHTDAQTGETSWATLNSSVTPTLLAKVLKQFEARRGDLEAAVASAQVDPEGRRYFQRALDLFYPTAERVVRELLADAE